jgi:hypothetical protein
MIEKQQRPRGRADSRIVAYAAVLGRLPLRPPSELKQKSGAGRVDRFSWLRLRECGSLARALAGPRPQF